MLTPRYASLLLSMSGRVGEIVERTRRILIPFRRELDHSANPREVNWARRS
jgi:hypothetical protein